MVIRKIGTKQALILGHSHHLAQHEQITASGYCDMSLGGMTDWQTDWQKQWDILTYILYTMFHFLWCHYNQSIVLWLLWYAVYVSGWKVSPPGDIPSVGKCLKLFFVLFDHTSPVLISQPWLSAIWQLAGYQLSISLLSADFITTTGGHIYSSFPCFIELKRQ